METAPVKLIAKDGNLYLPGKPEADGLFEANEPKILLCIYPAGDCDTIKSRRPNKKNLSRALYDAVETGDLPSDCSEVLLPNGKPFKIEDYIE